MTKYRIIGLKDNINNPTLFTPWSLIHVLSASAGMAILTYFNINKLTSIFIFSVFNPLMSRT